MRPPKPPQSISDTTFRIVVSVPDLGKNITRNLDVGKAFDQLLQLLPAKLVSVSSDSLAGIIAYDKYRDGGGYRSVYFSFEVEAADGPIAEQLLTQALNWMTR